MPLQCQWQAPREPANSELLAIANRCRGTRSRPILQAAAFGRSAADARRFSRPTAAFELAMIPWRQTLMLKASSMRNAESLGHGPIGNFVIDNIDRLRNGR